ncbi:HET-domain-containing protein [Pyrenochaeta sp. DS3sAY3a]|nr:HET-domain-containing protein [Pyrenochaeta sp. DS3sAY3a]
METLTASFTLEEYIRRLQAEASQASVPVHTCELCSKLLIKRTPNSTVGNRLFCKLEGFTQISVAEVAASNCPLFEKWPPRCGWDNLLEQGSWQFSMFIVPSLFHGHDKDETSDQLNEDGFEAWVRAKDSTGKEEYIFSPLFKVSLDEEANYPSWLTTSPMWRSSPANDDTFARAKGWLEDCLHSGTHVRCMPIPDNFVPSRLIKIPGDERSSEIDIIQTTKSEFVQWCALSYCWGGPQPSQTTTSNFQLGVRALQLSDIPKTILDAIVVASKMSVPYLWVDSLCILQDDPEDLKRELACMPKIYKYSVVTLIAGTSSSSHQGFLHDRDFSHRWDTEPVRQRYEDEHGERTTIILHNLSNHTTPEPIDYRAWALQELLLAPRALIFGTSMLAWNCLSHTRHESSFRPSENEDMSRLLKLAKHITRKDSLWHENNNCWISILVQYSQRKLSFADDRLIAIAAVAEEFGVAKRWDYAAGLWRQAIRETCTWFYKSHMGNCRPNKYRSPSWSWASIDSEISLYFSHLPFFDIIDVVTEPATQELPYGNTKSGYMTVSGKVVIFHLRRGSNTKDRHTQAFLSLDRGILCDIYLDAPEDDLEGWHECVEWKGDLTILGSRSDPDSEEFPALILKPVSITENIYQRVGILFDEVGSEVFQILQSAEQTTLTIV